MYSLLSLFVSITFFLAVQSGFAQQTTVVINEIMFAPAQGQAEWIELYNSTPQAIDLRSWVLHDATSSRPVITESSLWIPPNEFLIIAKDSSILDDFPDPAMRLFVMTKLPSLNNSGDDITLALPDSTVIDFVPYKSAWGGTSGNSLERIDPFFSSSDQSNWSGSQDSAKATPGRKNSVSRKDFNLAVGNVLIDKKDISIAVKNVGLKTSGTATVLLFCDLNGDSITIPSEEIDRRLVGPIAVKDSITIRFQNVLRRPGTQLFIFHIMFPEDEAPSDNTYLLSTFLPLEAGSLRINEIMFAPFTNQAEWVEYINNSPDTIDIRGFSFTRKPSSDGKRSLLPISTTTRPIPPSGYLVLASDSSIFSMYPSLLPPPSSSRVVILNRSLNLSNEGDECVLFDPTNTMLDSVSYSPSWHNKNLSSTSGRSLERLSPAYATQEASNWSSCTRISGGTPGERNSVFTEIPTNRTSDSPALRCTPNPFSPDGDGSEDYCVVSFTLSSALAQIRLRVYDTQGRLVRTIANNQPTGRAGEIIWDGLDDSRQRLRIGMYILLLEAVDNSSQATEMQKLVVVIASKL